ncbi:MAG: SagB/ThcOx family dehydrogenase [Candidatus Eisenbacteria bacterium]
MKTRLVRVAGLMLALILTASVLTYGEGFTSIKLPEPRTEGGKPLMEALKERQTQREYGPEELPMQVMSDMLWAVFGINRAETGKRTAPSAMNMQEIDIYVALRQGLYVYDAEDHTLNPVLEADIRADTGPQPFVKDAPVNLVYVADYSKMTRIPGDMQDFYSGCDTGFISQNVYLFCASEGLATVVRGYVDKEALAKTMGLGEDKKVILAQTVGYPKTQVKEPEEKGD